MVQTARRQRHQRRMGMGARESISFTREMSTRAAADTQYIRRFLRKKRRSWFQPPMLLMYTVAFCCVLGWWTGVDGETAPVFLCRRLQHGIRHEDTIQARSAKGAVFWKLGSPGFFLRTSLLKFHFTPSCWEDRAVERTLFAKRRLGSTRMSHVCWMYSIYSLLETLNFTCVVSSFYLPYSKA